MKLQTLQLYFNTLQHKENINPFLLGNNRFEPPYYRTTGQALPLRFNDLMVCYCDMWSLEQHTSHDTWQMKVNTSLSTDSLHSNYVGYCLLPEVC